MRYIIGTLIAICMTSSALAQQLNYADRQAHLINNSPFIELFEFSFANEYRNRDYRLVTHLSWRNVGDSPITAFEVVIAYFDPFNRPVMSGGRWLIPGNNSGNWAPLEPGAESADGLIGHRAQDVFTAFVYVRAIRLENGTVWTFDEDEIRATIQQRLPEVRSFENVSPALNPDE
ncbi:hypothetical protein [Maricaulis sp.]|uniref:hypothetical protein n=1 Tax=Maricaulis sp. TaxID=1486257 RepID=UPI000C3BD35D|nr:hypothetical protein [Maricaulis sp.]MAC89380.1 hypothetical protein [Maricaulis sp.]